MERLIDRVPDPLKQAISRPLPYAPGLPSLIQLFTKSRTVSQLYNTQASAQHTAANTRSKLLLLNYSHTALQLFSSTANTHISRTAATVQPTFEHSTSVIVPRHVSSRHSPDPTLDQLRSSIPACCGTTPHTLSSEHTSLLAVHHNHHATHNPASTSNHHDVVSQSRPLQDPVSPHISHKGRHHVRFPQTLTQIPPRQNG